MLTNHWILRIIVALLFQCFRVLWNLKEKLFNPEGKEGAKIYDIAYRHNLDKICLPSSINNFCLKFKNTAPMTAILDDNVYLYYYNTENVTFVVAEQGKEIWRSKYGSFYKQAQYDHANQIIITSLEDFFTVCKSLPHPRSKLNFVHSTPRSGSTLLTQMFEETGQCIAVCEPEEFTPNPLNNLKPGITHKEKLQLFSAIGKYVARSVSNTTQYRWYVAKLIACNSFQYYDILQEVFPESKHMFLYRDFKPTIRSSLHAFPNFPIVGCVEGVAKFVPKASKIFMEAAINPINDTGYFSQDILEKFKRLWDECKVPYPILTIMTMLQYCCPYDFFTSKRALPAMKYEDIIENRLENTRKVFGYFGLPSSLIGNGLRAMEQDSQRNSVVTKKRIGTNPHMDLDGQVKWLADEFCEMFDVPKLEEGQRHHCTITCSSSFVIQSSET